MISSATTEISCHDQTLECPEITLPDFQDLSGEKILYAFITTVDNAPDRVPGDLKVRINEIRDVWNDPASYPYERLQAAVEDAALFLVWWPTLSR